MENLSIGVQRLALQFVPFLIAVIFHEYAHGWMAFKYGDPTARDAGRLTFNPIKHIDVLGTLILPIMTMLTGIAVLFGWAKPVPINPLRFKKYRPGLFWVALAGPGMNVILAVISAALFVGMARFMSRDFYLFEPLMGMAEVSVFLNFALCFFNLIPLPPLDGSRLVESVLSYEAMQKYEQLSQYSFWILLALLWTGALRILAGPIEFFGKLTIVLMAQLFGVAYT